MTECAKYAPMLARFRELTLLERAEIDEHRLGCSACRRLHEEYDRQDTVVRSVARERRPPADFRAEVLARIDRLRLVDADAVDAEHVHSVHQKEPSFPRLFQVRPRWQWSAASVVIAVAAAAALLLVPFGSRRNAPLTPRTVLAHAVAATTNPMPYSGASESTFLLLPDQIPDTVTTSNPFTSYSSSSQTKVLELPDQILAAAAPDLGMHRSVSTWSVRDATHWRIDTDVLQPALQEEHQVAEADGTSAIWYRGISNHAARSSLADPQAGSMLLSSFQGGRGVPLAQTLEQYLQALNNPTTRTHARLMGQATILGRTADVVEVWPLVWVSTSNGSCQETTPCSTKVRGNAYGRARLWIDHEHGVVLRYQESDFPPVHGFDQDFVYRVTSLDFGRAPTAADLRYQPSVQPTSVDSMAHPGGGGGTVGSDGSWQPPMGFISVGPPTDVQGQRYALASAGQIDDALFAAGSVNALYVLNGAGSSGNSFVYIQEQRRITGLPAQFASGTPHIAGHCTVYTGAYPDGLHWLAVARNEVSLLAVAKVLSEQDLVGWASAQICK